MNYKITIWDFLFITLISPFLWIMFLSDKQKDKLGNEKIIITEWVVMFIISILIGIVWVFSFLFWTATIWLILDLRYRKFFELNNIHRVLTFLKMKWKRIRKINYIEMESFPWGTVYVVYDKGNELIYKPVSLKRIENKGWLL